MSDPTPDSDKKLVNAHVEQLMEHFDTVQIFVTRHMPAEADGTVSASLGAGNWLARRGQIRDWQLESDERIRHHARRPTT